MDVGTPRILGVDNGGAGTSAHVKRPYETPTLVEYGAVTELTRGAGGSKTDTGNPRHK